MLDEILNHNKNYVEKRKKQGPGKEISGHAQKEAMIFTCMDTRLVGLVEDAMGFQRGQVKVLKNAGNTIIKNCSDVLRSIALGVLVMGIREVFVVGHKDCGMKRLTASQIENAMRERGIDENVIASINLEEWSGIISDETENIRKAVKAIKSYEFIPEDVGVHGLLIDPYSGQLELVKAY